MDVPRELFAALPPSQHGAVSRAYYRGVADSDYLAEALTSLAHSDNGEPCFCQKAIGNPMQPDHSRVCANARAALAKFGT